MISMYGDIKALQTIFAAICWIKSLDKKFFEFQPLSCLWIGSSIESNEIQLE